MSSVRVTQFNDTSTSQNSFVPSENIDLPTLRQEIANFLKTFDFTPYLPKQKRLEEILDTDYLTSETYPGQPSAIGVLEKASRADHVHAAPDWGPVNVAFVGQEAYNGVQGLFARSDHSHGSPQFPYGSVTQEITFGTLKNDGADTRGARADHQHGNPVFPYSVTVAPLVVGAVSNVGASSLVAREDHVHGLPNWGTPVNVGAQNFAGTQNLFSRSDHVHAFSVDAIPYANTVVSETAFNQQPSPGNTSTFSRGDHTHGSTPDADLVHKTLAETLVGAKTFTSATTRVTDQAAAPTTSPFGAKSLVVFGSGFGVVGGTDTDTLTVSGQTNLAALSASSVLANTGSISTLTSTSLTVTTTFNGSVITSANIVDGTIQDADVAAQTLTRRTMAFDTIQGGTQAGQGQIAAGTIQQYNLAANITAAVADDSVTGGPLGGGVKIRQNTITHHNVYSKTLRNSEMILGGMPVDDPTFKWSIIGQTSTDTPWTLGTGWSVVATQGRDGGNCGQHVGGQDLPLVNGFAFDASIGDVYSASLWCKSGTVAPNGSMYAKIAWYDALGAFISYGNELVLIGVSPGTSWAQAQVVSQAPNTAATGRVQALTNGHSVGLWLVDDFACARSIGTNQILDAAVTVLKLADRAVSTVKMQLNSVTDQILALSSVYTSAIQDGAVTLQKMAENSVSNAQITASTIVASQKIQPGTITSDLFAQGVAVSNVAADSVKNQSISAEQVYGAIPPTGAPTGAVKNIAQRTIAAINIAANTITGNEITQQTLTLAGSLVVTGTTTFNSAVTTASGTPMTVNGAFQATTATINGLLSAGDTTVNSLTSLNDVKASGFVQGRSAGSAGIAFKVGNDLNILDLDVANTAGLQGGTDPTKAALKFGSGGQTISGDGGGIYITGSVLQIGGSQVLRLADAGGTVVSEQVYGVAATAGIAAAFSRSDHSHGSPNTPVTSLITSGNLSLNGSTGALTLTLAVSPSFINTTLTGFMDFGTSTRQMINLYGGGPNAAYGIGTQASTYYARSASGFAWYKGGSHSDAQNDPGTNGTVQMRLDSSGNLFVPGTITFQNGSGTNSQLQPDSSYVHIAGPETITGQKTFSLQPILSAGAVINAGSFLQVGSSTITYNTTGQTLDIKNGQQGTRLLTSNNTALLTLTDTALTMAGTFTAIGQTTLANTVLVGSGAGRQNFSDDGVYAYHQSDRDLVFSAVGGGVQRLRLTTTGDALFAGSLTIGGTNLSGPGVDRVSYGLRSNVAVTGGGTITLSNAFDLNWSARLVVINVGSGANSSTGGYFDITMPPIGTTITGVGGAQSVTVGAAGISLAGTAAVTVGGITTTQAQPWVALWYILPIGSSNATNNSNFRISAYTAGFTAPSDWILIANKNADSGTLRLCTGQYLTAGNNVDNTRSSVTNDAAYVHINGVETIYGAKTFNATTTFNQAVAFPSSQFGSPVSEQTYGLASSPGTSGQIARSDHTHGSPPPLPWNQIGGKPANWLTQSFLTGDPADFGNSFNNMANRTSGFFQVNTSNTAGPDTTLAYTALQVRTNSASTNVGMQLAMATTNNDLYVRSFTGGNGGDGSGTFQTWGKVFSSTNLNPMTLDTIQTVSAQKSFTNATTFFYGASATNYTTPNIQLQVSGSTVRPRVAFHMSGVVASQLAMDSDGHFTFADNPGTGRSGARASFFDAPDLRVSGTSAIATTDTYLRINQSNQFSSGIWLGSSTLRAAGGGMYLGSTGGDGQIALLPSTADTTRRITLNGATGDLTITGRLSVSSFTPGTQYLNDNPIYFRSDTNHYAQYNSTIDGPILVGYSGVGFYRTYNGLAQIGRIDVNGNMYIPGTLYSNNGSGSGQQQTLTVNSLYATGSISAGNGAVVLDSRGITANQFRIDTGGNAYFNGSLEVGAYSQYRLRIVNTGNASSPYDNTQGDRDAIQWMAANSNTVEQEIRGTMSEAGGARGITINGNVQLGHTQATLYQVAKRATNSPGQNVRVRAGHTYAYFSGGSANVTFGSAMSQSPTFVLVTMSTGSDGRLPIYQVTNFSSSGFTINIQVQDSATHQFGPPGGTPYYYFSYYAEITV